MPIRIYNFSKSAFASRKNRFLWYLPTFVVLTNVLWISREFGNPTVEQFIYHIQFGAEGLYGYDKTLLFNYIKNTILRSVFYSSLAILIEEIFLSRLVSKQPKTHLYFKVIIGNKLPIIIFFVATLIGFSRFSVYAYLSASDTVDFIKSNYVNPSSIDIQKSKNPKNLILIYLESMETSYRREDIFGRNALAEIDSLGGIEFPKLQQLPGTGWTIAGIVSSQCSIPLKPVALADGNLQGEISKEFLPGATCLGDTLKQLGYTNVFLGGASLDFAGKGKYFKTHGYSKVVGKKSWLASNKYTVEDMNDWGLHDDDLFNEALKSLAELKSQNRPFNLTLLTVDTHPPRGYLSKTCKEMQGKDYLDIIECTSRLVHNFIKEAEKLGYLKDTQIVILGDHLSMPTTVKEKIDMVGDRYIYNRWISKSEFSSNRKEITHFDIAPTIIEFLGHKIIGDRYGLGFTALNKSDAEISKFDFAELYEGINRRSNYYNGLWYKNKQ